MRWVHAATVVALGLAGCAGDDGRELTGPASTTPSPRSAPPSSPSSSPSSSPAASSVPTAGPTTAASTAPTSSRAVTPQGFDRVAATATTAAGEVCDLCLWLASDAEQRGRGLMFASEIGAADGMAFVYQEPTSTSFWMRNTRLPLSIVFFDRDGAYLDGFDMEPCLADPCERYATPAGFSVAIEVEQGAAAGLGLLPGSTVVVSGLPCEGTDDAAG